MNDFFEDCVNNDIAVVLATIDKVDINFKYERGITALIQSSYFGYTNLVDILIKHGAIIDDIDNKGDTALLHSSRRGKKETSEFLINKGADINHKNKFGVTALMKAVVLMQFETIECLINMWADINIKNNRNKSAFDIAFEDNDIILFILLKPDLINDQDENGDTYINKAIKKGYEECVLFLLKKGSDLSIRNSSGYSAFDSLIIQDGLSPALQALKEKFVLEKFNDQAEEISLGL